MTTAPLAERSDRSDRLRAALPGLAATAAVLLGLLWFFVVMAYYEPLTGDGYYSVESLNSFGFNLQYIIASLEYLHQHGNPRIAQVFTILVYGQRSFHLIATPLFSLSLVVLVFVHALGRWPRPTSLRDALLLMFGAAALFLAVPQPGHAFFYRPVTTHYIYTMVLVLLFFLPQRFDVRLQSWPAAVAAAVVALAFGAFVGKCNEHTGPTLIVVAALYALLAVRRRDWKNSAWTGAGTLALLIGYLYLFFAPGQAERYGSLGRQSVMTTITERGLLGTATLLGEFAGYVAPLFIVMTVIVLAAALLDRRGSDVAPPQLSRAALYTVGAYVLLAGMVLATDMAAPKNHYRLFVAPAILLSIAALALLHAIFDNAAARIGAVLIGAIVHVVFIILFVSIYREIHEDEQARLALIEKADHSQPVIVPRYRSYRRSPFFYGDSITADPRHRARMAKLFGLVDVRVLKGTELTPPAAKKKFKYKPKPRPPDPPVALPSE